MIQLNRYFIVTFLSLIATTIFSDVFAQTLTGKVVDENNEPLAYANVILQKADSTYIDGTVTDTCGVFTLNTNPDAVRLQVSFVSYVTSFHSIKGYDFGTIQMQPDTEMLGKAVVKAIVPKTTIQGDAFVTEIENSILAKAGSANDVLKKLPGVIQKNGGIEVFGKGTPIIYINGRLVRDNSELELLNSSNIKSVDVVQNPGARYDATVRAVIRIKTIKRQGDGFGFNLRSSWWQTENTDLLETINMNYRRKGLDVFGTVSYSQAQWVQEAKMTQKLESSNPLILTQDSYFTGSDKDLTTILGFNYQFNDNHSFGMRYRPFIDFETSSYNNSHASAMIGGKLDDNTHTIAYGNSEISPSHSANLYYNGTVGKLKIDFNADLIDSRNSESTSYDETSELQDNRVVTTLSQDQDKLYASKLVLTYPILGGSVTAGSEYTYTYRKDQYVNDEGYIPNSFTTIQEDNINAFIEYLYPFKFGSISAGVRYEHLAFNYYEDDVRQDSQSRKFNDFYPNISFNAHKGKFMFQLNYATKTSRPSYSLLSNAVTYIDRYSYTKGNPYLIPEINHDLSLATVWNFLQFAATYQVTQNAIVHLGTHQEGNENGILLYNTNFDRDIPTLQAMLSASPTISFWYPRMTIGVQKQWLSVEYLGKEKDMSKPIPFLSFGSSFQIPKGFLLDFDYNFTGTGSQRIYELIKATHLLNISVRKSFLKDALSVELKGVDLFKTKQVVAMYSGAYEILQDNRNDSRGVFLTVRYKFNSANNKYKGTGAGEQQKNRM